jgi:hypothetical protein
MSKTKGTQERWMVSRTTFEPPENVYLVIETATEHIAFVFTDKPQNARLIAAAPEMAEALSALCNIATHPKSTKAQIVMIAKEARTLLAKIEGGK